MSKTLKLLAISLLLIGCKNWPQGGSHTSSATSNKNITKPTPETSITTQVGHVTRNAAARASAASLKTPN